MSTPVHQSPARFELLSSESEPLLAPESDGSPFVSDKRCRTNGGWLVAYLIVLILVIPGGIYGAHYSWTACTVLGSLGLGLGFVALVRHHPGLLVGTAVSVKVLLPVAIALVLAYYGQGGWAALPLVWAGLLSLALWWYRDQIRQVARLMGVAGRALVECPGLLGLAVGLQLALTLAAAPLVAMGIGAYSNGRLIFNPERSLDPSVPNSSCLDSAGKSVDCCAWETDGWVTPYLALLGLALSWTVLLVFEIKVFTVAGTVAQVTQRVVQRSNSLLCCLLASVGRALYSLLEYFTRMVTMQMALSGLAFMPAAHTVLALLKRNGLDALASSALVVAAVFGLAVGLLSVPSQGVAAADKELEWEGRAGLGYMAFLAAWVVLSFFCALLVNIMEAVFLCFAIDRERRTVSHLEVHQLFCSLPNIGPVVQQPDGAVMYGMPPRPMKTEV
ncbi:hypothetical protein QJQ45_003697 [Haematococcus lacustris]|nr:hypothetical protein QJQ45_003697 [Haematococcus lacustris]